MSAPEHSQLLAGGVGEQDLTAMTGVADPGHHVDGETDIPGVGDRRAPAVQPDPDTNLKSARPHRILQSSLDLYGGCEGGCAGSLGKDGEELVGPRIDLISIVTTDCLPG